MKRYSLLMAILVMALSACKFKVDVPGSKIRNGVQVKATGLKVSQAFLVDQSGNLVPDDNLVKVNEYLTLRLFIDGWTTKAGMVNLGASEKLETSEKEIILDEKDLFAGNEQVTAEDAKVIALKVVLTGVNKLYDYYLVTFRVWDKNGTGEVTGSYKFNIKAS